MMSYDFLCFFYGDVIATIAAICQIILVTCPGPKIPENYSNFVVVMLQISVVFFSLLLLLCF